MSAGYKSARAHLEDAIALVHKLVERQITAHWEMGILPKIKDEFSGTFVSGGEVGALLNDEGKSAAQEKGKSSGEIKLMRLDQEIRTRSESIEAKLAANRKTGVPLPFDQLRSTFGLSPTEQRALWILVAIEVSANLRQLMRYLVNEASRIHADVGLLEILVYSAKETRDRLIIEMAPDGRLFRHRLLESIGTPRQVDEAPFLLRPLKVSPRVIELVHGVVRLDPKVAEFATLVRKPPGLETLVMDQTVKQEVTRLLAARTSPGGGPPNAVLISGSEGSGRKALAFGAAHQQHCAALHVRCDDLPTDSRELPKLCRSLVREAILFRAMPIFENIDSLPGDPETGRNDRSKPLDKALGEFLGPIAGTCARHDSRPVNLRRGAIVVDVEVPSEAERNVLWNRALGEQEKLDIDRIAARYPITGGILIKSAEAATALAEARQDAVTDEDVHAGLRATLDSKLSNLGKRIQWRQTWDDLVLPDDSIEELNEFMARMKHRRRVYDQWGFSRKMAKGLGLSALFAGPPGTGKTMVAGLIASELSLDLYQIDLSRIVSKYVGETEKNLAELFDAAEAGHAILLFDEADSLFAKRTEVKSSVDRYANLEVNYLLQRMEAFSGMTILTTNLDSSIDDAFRRRISFKVDFPFPEPEDRARLWRTMLPDEATVSGDIQYERLAERYEMSGGYIRNAVLRAAFLAASEDSPINMDHMLRAGNLEYQSMGKVISHLK